ncbi:hypothetical protein DVR12_13000 [Chitinophaga silvatica]|uniref:site-specific DNA-methyltransferase (adenine-specific) n=1 Tax=Chitinophaga silvatica TaxID=2282649 RepID=A0A3E1YAJ8_9BACT|nr:N-6 DNA methylase [Chitinophaga silvatica]RFS22705.1 hypothetical protein DVR12_13000 [Chitinophaga silvatica]
MRRAENSTYNEVGETTSSAINMAIHSKKEELQQLANLSSEERKKKLGQVFTPKTIAQVMASIIKKDLKPKQGVLDPCIGPNTFLSCFSDLSFQPSLIGIEIDKNLITPATESFYKEKNRELVLDNFLTYPISQKFDYIIQNPPYVRQELLSNGVNTKKLATENIGEELSKQIPTQSNLYVYFLIKSIQHLKDKGTMVAIIYDSWLYSSFGKELKNIFLTLGTLKNIYHFKHNAFEDAEVGATIIEFCKEKKRKGQAVSYYAFDSFQSITSINDFDAYTPTIIQEKDFPDYNFNSWRLSSIDFETWIFSQLKSISDQPIQRGIASGVNDFFLHDTKRFEESVPIIKDVSKVPLYSAKSHTDYLLSINEEATGETKSYLVEVKDIITNSEDKYKAVKDKIKSGKNWYKINLKKPGNFIFNYYLRKNIDFILNEQQYYASDNFYIMQIQEEPDAHLAILNSSFTRISVLQKSRSQGNGLRKIQLYEFADVPVMNINKLAQDTISKLKSSGTELRNQNRYTGRNHQLIRQIDEILLAEYNQVASNKITLEDLETELKKYIS